MVKASDLIEQGRHAEVWQQYCGFLDLDVAQFMKIQERLLLEELQLVSKSILGRMLMGDEPPQTVEAFRRQVPLTTYDDYALYFDEQREDVLPEKPIAWAHSSGRGGRYKWVPYGPIVYRKLGEAALAGFLLCTARQRGEVRLRKRDVFVYNTPARPYMSAYAMRSMSDQFDFTLVPPLELAESVSFQERIELAFRMALRQGMDIVGSLSSVLLRVGERFSHGSRSLSLSRDLLHPGVIWRILRGMIRSKLQNRPLLPRDLWTLKGAMAGGTDTSIYRPQLAAYWGVEVHEQYGCTEFGIMATQAWDRRGLYFLPDIAFYEFIPPDEWERSRQDPTYQPRTLLLSETKPGERYEIVMTSLHGGPFLRYRLHDLVQFTAPEERDPSIALPSFTIKGRTMDLIDLAGFTGVIDEQSAWRALAATGLEFAEWSLRKEVERDRPVLHLYIELKAPTSADEVHHRLDAELRISNPFYSDIEKMLGYNPLRVTVLPRETFLHYMYKQQAAGADLSHLKPPRLNASDAVIAQLKEIAATLA